MPILTPEVFIIFNASTQRRSRVVLSYNLLRQTAKLRSKHLPDQVQAQQTD